MIYNTSILLKDIPCINEVQNNVIVILIVTLQGVYSVNTTGSLDNKVQSQFGPRNYSDTSVKVTELENGHSFYLFFHGHRMKKECEVFDRIEFQD